jgi:hypothetical protein
MTHTVGIYTQTATATPAPVAASSELQECFAWLSTGTTSMTGAPQDPPMSEQLATEIREALARVERGQVVDLGSFAQYADDDSED